MVKLDGVICDCCRKRIRIGESDNYFDICESCQKDATVVDNFDQIYDMMIFDDPNTFYWVQVIGRKKDNPETGVNRVRAEFVIHSIEQLQKLKPELIKLSRDYNARVVFWVNRRDLQELAIPMAKLTLSYIESKQFNALPKVFQRVCGQQHKKGIKILYIVDVDIKNETYLNKVVGIIKECGKVEIEQLIPTVKGFHVICTGFNVELFNMKTDEAGLGKIDVHKDNPTLLYYCP